MKTIEEINKEAQEVIKELLPQVENVNSETATNIYKLINLTVDYKSYVKYSKGGSNET